MNRRQFLKYGGISALGISVAGCGGEQDAQTTDGSQSPASAEPDVERPRSFRSRFGTVENVVDHGIEPGGGNPIDDELTDLMADDTLLIFPEGRYTVKRLEVGGYDNLGLVSEKGAAPTIVPSVPSDEIDNQFVQFLDVARFYIDGFDFDFTEERFGGVVRIRGRGDVVARNLTIRGKMPDKDLPSTPAAFHFGQIDESSRGVVENAVAKAGGHQGGNAVGIYVEKDHAGELIFRDCNIQNFPNNGLYASAPGRNEQNFAGKDGPVHVEGGLYRNNNIANIRIGSTGSTVKDARVVADEEPPHPEGSLNVRGIRLRGKEGQVVDNCEIRFGENAGSGFGALVFHPDTGRATVRNTKIEIHQDGVHAINALPVQRSGASTGSTFENVEITGSAANGRAVSIESRDGTSFENCRVVQRGRRRAGFFFFDSQDCSVTGTTIKVTGKPIQNVNSTVNTQDLSIEQVGFTGI